MKSSPAASETSAGQAPAKPRGSGLNIVLALLLATQVVLSAAALGWWWMKQSSGAAPALAGPSSPIAVVPEPAPSLPAMTLASVGAPAAGSGSAAGGRQLTGLTNGLDERLKSLPLDGGAPSHLIALGSGQQVVEKIAEIPRHQRWELQFPPGNNVESYARQLEYFHIELGLIGGSDQITYLSGLANPTPVTRTGAAAAESRLYLIWQRGSMQEADEQIVNRAKLPLADRVVAHFCPPDMETQLVQLEDTAAKAAGRKRIRKTVFAVRPNDFGGYRLQVLQQQGD